MKGDEVMYNESAKSMEFLSDIYNLLNAGDTSYLDSTTNNLVGYMKKFIDSYEARSKDETDYVSNEEYYKHFRSNFLTVYNKYGTMHNARYTIPLFVYLFDQNPMGFNLDKFMAFADASEGLGFNELSGIYDAYEPGMDLTEEKSFGVC
jgi:hypothetical protein